MAHGIRFTLCFCFTLAVRLKFNILPLYLKSKFVKSSCRNFVGFDLKETKSIAATGHLTIKVSVLFNRVNFQMISGFWSFYNTVTSGVNNLKFQQRGYFRGQLTEWILYSNL